MDRIDITEDLSFSRIVYGMSRLTEDDTSTDRVREKIDACLEIGITTIDQADIYGAYTAESVLGSALAADPGLRDRIEIVTKCNIVIPAGQGSSAKITYYDSSAEHIRASVDQSLKDMGIERIDVLLLHRPDPLMDHLETAEALDGLVDAGKVRAIGVSNFRPWDCELLASAMKAPIVTNQIEVSLAAHQGFANGDVAFHQRRGEPIMAWSPLGGGTLVTGQDQTRRELHTALAQAARDQGVDTSAVAVAWLLRHPAKLLPVMGTNRPERIARIADAEKVEMTREAWFRLYAAALGHPVP